MFKLAAQKDRPKEGPSTAATVLPGTTPVSTAVSSVPTTSSTAVVTTATSVTPSVSTTTAVTVATVSVETPALNAASSTIKEEEEDVKTGKKRSMTVSASNEPTSTLTSTVITVSTSVVNTSSTTVSVTTQGGPPVHSTAGVSASSTSSDKSAPVQIRNPALAAVVAALRSSSLEKANASVKDKARFFKQ